MKILKKIHFLNPIFFIAIEDPVIIKKLGTIISTHHYPKHLGAYTKADMELDLNYMRGLKTSKNLKYAMCINNDSKNSQIKILDLSESNKIIFDEEHEQLNFSVISNNETLAAFGGRSNGKDFIKIYDFHLKSKIIVSWLFLTVSQWNSMLFLYKKKSQISHWNIWFLIKKHWKPWRNNENTAF